MKFVYCANVRIPTEKAHGLQIMKMCEALASRGYSVTLVVPRRINPRGKGIDPFIYYGATKNFKVVRLWVVDPLWLMKVGTGLYIKAQLFFFSVSLLCYRLFKRSFATAVSYTRDEYLLPLLQFFSSKVVWEAHTIPSRAQQYLRYWNRCIAIIAISHGIKRDLVALGVSEKRIIVAADAVDVERFAITISKKEARKKLNIPEAPKIILYAGHLYKWKGVETLIDAAPYIPERAMIFIVGGTDHDIAHMRSKARGKENVVLLGYKPPTEIPLYLKAADVLVLPNSAAMKISSEYTSPMKLYEYMASGTPIIVSDVPALREALSEDAALWVTPDDSFSLAKGITQILSNPALGEVHAACALALVKGHTWAARATGIVDFISNQ